MNVVAAAVVEDGRLLVVSKMAAPGVYYLPGGKPELGETPEQTLTRELGEELGGHPTAVLHRIVAEDPDLSGLDGELRELVAACLSKDPADRPEVAYVLARCAGAEDTGGWLPEPVTTMVAAADVPNGPATPDKARRGLATTLGRFSRRRKRPARGAAPSASASARRGSLADSIAQGWNGLRWGATKAGFQARFPGAGQNGEWWVTGQGRETFCGFEMLVQYGFNDDDRLCLVALYPEPDDRDMVTVAVINELGPPDGEDILWTIGAVEVSVKMAGIAVTMTHTRLASV